MVEIYQGIWPYHGHWHQNPVLHHYTGSLLTYTFLFFRIWGGAIIARFTVHKFSVLCVFLRPFVRFELHQTGSLSWPIRHIRFEPKKGKMLLKEVTLELEKKHPRIEHDKKVGNQWKQPGYPLSVLIFGAVAWLSCSSIVFLFTGDGAKTV